MIRAGGAVNHGAMAAGELSPGHFDAVARRPGSATPATSKRRPVYQAEPYSWYVEERWVSAALFANEAFGRCVVDPCAGLGNVVWSARSCGLSAFGSDVIKRAERIAGGRDFLSERWRPPHPRPLSRIRDLRNASPGGEGGFSIVGNPPWGGRENLLRAFAEAACERAEKVALLAPAHRLAAAGAWLKKLPLARVLYVSPRPSMWPGPIYLEKIAAAEPLRNGHQDFAWLIFQRGFGGRPSTGWLRRAA
jgi:hypothetical protein